MLSHRNENGNKDQCRNSSVIINVLTYILQKTKPMAKIDNKLKKVRNRIEIQIKYEYKMGTKLTAVIFLSTNTNNKYVCLLNGELLGSS